MKDITDLSLLTLLFVWAKIAGHIDWSWLVVFWPIWLSWAAWPVALFLVVVGPFESVKIFGVEVTNRK